MSRFSSEQLEKEWKSLLLGAPPGVMARIQWLISQHAGEMATHFYTYMLQDPVASQFLSHDQVKTRLHGSMQNWLSTIFAIGPQDDLQAVVALQIKVGEVHARIDLPVHVVLRGARGLKNRFHEVLNATSELEDSKRSQILQLSFSIIDLAIEIMSQAYSSFHDRNARAEESYRLFSVAQNLATEREKQRAALLDWENQIMFEHAVGQGGTVLPALGASEFGLWFRHKGAHAFQGTVETDEILESIKHIDNVLLQRFDPKAMPNRQTQVLNLRELHEQTKAIAFHLDNLFEQHNELEAGRDVLTRLLSRKYLSVVLNKEVQYARRSGTVFAVAALDIDYFKRINDQNGHEAGDAVLQQVAAILNNSTRGGDYVFRLGGEEFLIVLVDVKPDGALRMVQSLRQKIQNEVFRLPQGLTASLSVSMGLAFYNGHPDHHQILRRADTALYDAKVQGRNRVIVASG
ncbi:MAG: diguanylate cyclase [Burkholderiaceae bacterium]|nr:diguanylate cyclase [Burkholderiaceae bacterium]